MYDVMQNIKLRQVKSRDLQRILQDFTIFTKTICFYLTVSDQFKSFREQYNIYSRKTYVDFVSEQHFPKMNNKNVKL